MSKSVLVIDTPERCGNCSVQRSCLIYYFTKERYKLETLTCRAPRCPLKPMPERKIEHDWCDPYEPDFEMGTERGWNDCIDEILGGAYK